MSSSKKDTIYIDVDDEITSVIDKLKASHHSIIAFVLPKRAAMLQSTVNMKLLKKAAKDARKSIVLITNEHSILLLAGAVGVHVARSLQSVPTIPPRPERPDTDAPIDVEPGEEPIDPKATVGELSGRPEEDETIQVDNDPPKAKAAAGKPKKDKKLKIPNFDQFRTRLFLGIAGLVLLIIGWFWAFVLAPRGTIVIKTDTQSVTGTMDFIADSATVNYDQEQKLLPAASKELQKNLSEKVAATGEKNVGEKAMGTMTIYNCTDNTINVPSGTLFTNSGLSFATREPVAVPPSDFFSDGKCKKNRSADIGVTATQSGDNHNLSAGREYTSNFGSSLTGKGSAMTGGSTKLVKIVSQADVDNARQRLVTQHATVSDELKVMLAGDGLTPLAESIINSEPKVAANPAVGAEAPETTVTVDTTFAMLGVKEDDLKKLIESQVASQLDTSRQAITDHGLKDAAIRLLEKKSDKQFRMSLQTVVTAGPQINPDALKDEIRGKKRGDIETILSGRPGFKEVEVNFSPFWVFSMPKSAKKITVTIEQINNVPPQ